LYGKKKCKAHDILKKKLTHKIKNVDTIV